MTYKEKTRIVNVIIAVITAVFIGYKIGYHYGTVDATQETSDELLEYCESKIDERANEICGQ